MKIIFLLTIVSFTFGIQFPIPNDSTEKCLSEQFAQDSLIKGEFSISPASDYFSLSVSILEVIPGKEENIILQRANSGTRVPFSFTSQQDAEYHFCLRDSIIAEGVTGNRVGSVVWKESNAQFQEFVKKSDLLPLEQYLAGLMEEAQKVKVEFTSAREREAAHRSTSENTFERLSFLSIISVGIVVSVSAIQIYYMRYYFKSKKLI